MERRLLTWAKNTLWRQFDASRLPCDRVALSRRSLRPSLRWDCSLQAPSACLRDGGHCLRQDSKGNSAECREIGRCVLIWDPEPRGRRKPSAFVLRLKRLSNKVSLKTA